MANPQAENGYTRIANEIMDALIRCDLSGQEFKLLLLVIRKTYGFQKTEDKISLSQMVELTGMCKIRCSQVVNRLQLMKILTVTENINGIGKKYKFNKDFESWSTVNEKCNRYKKVKGTVNVLRNRPLMKTVTTKESITKEKKQKKTTTFVLPSDIEPKTWDAFVEIRMRMKAPLTDHAKELIISKLSTIGQDKNRVLNQSIENGWKGVFPLKDMSSGNGFHTNTEQEQREPPKAHYFQNKDGTWTRQNPDGSHDIVDKPPPKTPINEAQKLIKTIAGVL